MSLFTVTEYDKEFYYGKLKDFLPDKMIDIHTHVYKDEFRKKQSDEPLRAVTWPSLVAKDNPIEDLIETYRIMFPDKNVSALMFSNLSEGDDFTSGNKYISECAKKTGWGSLYFSHPRQSAEELENAVISGGFLGVKSYLTLSPSYFPEAEIRIFDFFPHHQLQVLNRYGMIMILHIPRPGRFRDNVNLQQIKEIKDKYPKIKLIIAHVGRAYCPEDVGNAFEELAEYKDLLFDFCANCCEPVLENLIHAVGPERIMFGSDMPILRMRTHRICENGRYVNLIPPGLYGDPSQDSHLREVSEEEGKRITFFMYEEIYAMKQAANAYGCSDKDVERIFYKNAEDLISEVKSNIR